MTFCVLSCQLSSAACLWQKVTLTTLSVVACFSAPVSALDVYSREIVQHIFFNEYFYFPLLLCWLHCCQEGIIILTDLLYVVLATSRLISPFFWPHFAMEVWQCYITLDWDLNTLKVFFYYYCFICVCSTCGARVRTASPSYSWPRTTSPPAGRRPCWKCLRRSSRPSGL